MRSSAALDRDGVMAVLDRYRAAVSELVELRLDALDVPDLFVVLDTVEAGRCRVPVIEHDAINQIAALATAEQIGKSLKKVLADRLRITVGEAGRLIADAEVLGRRAAMTGEPLAPLWSATASGQRAGVINASGRSRSPHGSAHDPDRRRRSRGDIPAGRRLRIGPDDAGAEIQRPD